ncbi:hypothetical protein PYW07_007359 [Mythimna separata]|uniref:Uncharacterized protein n=1 Tax=Mythimna separata TaxID=271217 RepID=A0AAD7Z0H5_MYTSE|nr:hypothetical protein PYW07_007359 [Mythimna separata]
MDCNKDSHQYPGTEVVLATTELKGETKQNVNQDFSDEESVSVQNEVRRGIKLRNEKYRRNETIIIIPRAEPVKQRCVRKGHLESTNNIKRPNRCPSTGPNSVVCTPCNRISGSSLVQTKAKKSKRCPLRIAELAVPSKRQCFATWRDKSNVLPGFMVDRLKQQLMDQIPIAQIPEAIYYFKNEKRVKNSSTFKWFSCKQKQFDDQKLSQEMDTRMLCILFAHKVSQRLSRPLKVTLKGSSEKLIKVVSNDIEKMMYKNLGRINNDPLNKAIHTDISKKITFWITSILQDSYFKLLEEDLRAKEKTEAPTQTVLENSKPLVTIEKTVLEQKSPMKSKDLEEEEGPVLDFLDDLVENVLNICVPPLQYSDSNLSYSCGSKEHVVPTEETDKSFEISDREMAEFHEETTQDLTEEADDDKDLSSSEYFRSEITTIIDNITKVSDESLFDSFGNDIEEGSGINIENEDISFTSKIKPDVNNENEEEGLPLVIMDARTNILDRVSLTRSGDTGISVDAADAGIENDINDGNNEDNEEVPPVGEAKHDIDIRISNTGPSLETEIQHDTNDENLDKISESSPNVVDSDKADETHSNVSERFKIANKTDLVKADSTANKIKTSFSTTQEPKHTRWDSLTDTYKSSIIFAKPNEDLLRKHKTPSQLSDQLRKLSKALSTMDPTMKQLSSKGLDEEDMKTDREKRVKKSIKIASRQMYSAESERESANDTNKEDKIRDDKIRSKMNLGWKVHLKTAPSWVQAWGQGRGEPSEDSIPIKKKPTKVTENELRAWCKNLEKAFTNLDIWSNWISTICKESLFILKQRKVACPCLAKKGAMNWTTLRRNVQKDALLWTKLYQRTNNNFKIMKTKYNNVEYTQPTPISNRNLFEKLSEFENLRVKVHEMIVAAQCCVMCTCIEAKPTGHSQCRGYKTKR